MAHTDIETGAGGGESCGGSVALAQARSVERAGLQVGSGRRARLASVARGGRGARRESWLRHGEGGDRARESAVRGEGMKLGLGEGRSAGCFYRAATVHASVGGAGPGQHIMPG